MKNIVLNLFLLLFCYTKSFGQIGVNNIPIANECPNNQSNDTSGWSIFYANDIYNQTDFLSSTNSPGINYLQGSSTITNVIESNANGHGDRVSIIPFPDLLNEIGSICLSQQNQTNYIKIGGNLEIGGGSEEISRSYYLSISNPKLKIASYVRFSSGNGSQYNSSTVPFFKYKIEVRYNDGTLAVLPQNFSGFITPLDNGAYICKDRKTYINNFTLDFSSHIDFCKQPVVTISFMVSDCRVLTSPPSNYNNNNSACAYVSALCEASDEIPLLDMSDGKLCTNKMYNLIAPLSSVPSSSNIISTNWSITLNPSGSLVADLPSGINTFSFPSIGSYNIHYNIHYPNCNLSYNYNVMISNDCLPSSCVDCTSFDLELGKKYIITGWVNAMKDNGSGSYDKLNLYNYEKAKIAVSFLNVGGTVIGSQLIFDTSGEIIDGWQKIYGEFVVPNNIDDLKIDLVNDYDGSIVTFFDDIRVHPFDGNMKSFVYNQENQKLMAELDENNYATFYEYDKEGGLVRVKKETEKGVFTIQETRSSTTKKH